MQEIISKYVYDKNVGPSSILYEDDQYYIIKYGDTEVYIRYYGRTHEDWNIVEFVSRKAYYNSVVYETRNMVSASSNNYPDSFDHVWD